MKPFAYIIAALLLVILFQFLMTKCDHRKHERELQSYQAALDSCLTAEPQHDTLWMFKTLRDTIRLPFTYRVIERDTIRDIEKREYKGNYTTDLLAIRWRAVVFGELVSMEVLPTSSYRYPQITQTRVVALPARECEPARVSRERSHLYFNPELYWGDDAVFRVSLVWVGHRGWGLSGGLQTAFETGHFYYGGGVLIRLR